MTPEKIDEVTAMLELIRVHSIDRTRRSDDSVNSITGLQTEYKSERGNREQKNEQSTDTEHSSKYSLEGRVFYESTPENTPEHENTPEKNPENTPENTPEKTPEKNPENTVENDPPPPNTDISSHGELITINKRSN
jgi:hypothetical protein